MAKIFAAVFLTFALLFSAAAMTATNVVPDSVEQVVDEVTGTEEASAHEGYHWWMSYCASDGTRWVYWRWATNYDYYWEVWLPYHTSWSQGYWGRYGTCTYY